MWTLFKRECEDTWGYLLASFLIVTGSILTIEVKSKDTGPFDGVFGYGLLCTLLLAFSCSRTVLDRTHGISTFFAGHLTTRRQVFTVRILMGLLYVILFYVPLLCWFFWRLLSDNERFPDFLSTGPLQMAVFLLLFPITFYALGLKMGQSTNKVIPLFGSLCLGALLFSFVIIMGVDRNAIVLLVILIPSLIYSAWRNFAAGAL